MDTEKKHGLYKVVDQADKLARLVMDQLAKDGCANLENIRNAIMAPLVQIEQDHQDEALSGRENYQKARQQWTQHRPVTIPDHVELWKRICDGYAWHPVPATRPLLKALRDAIASGKSQCVSINDGTYVMPNGEVLSELEMINRNGSDGR